MNGSGHNKSANRPELGGACSSRGDSGGVCETQGQVCGRKNRDKQDDWREKSLDPV